MQRKYSEVVNYLPNFHTLQLRRNNRDVNNNQKLSPVEGYRPNHSPTINANSQYQQFLAPIQVPLDIASNRNTSFQNVQRRSLPVFNPAIQQNSRVNSPTFDPRPQNTNNYRPNGLMEQNSYPRRATQHNLSTQPIQFVHSPQNIIRTSQIEIGQYSDNPRRNIITINNSPNKIEVFQPKNTSYPYINLVPPPRQQQNRTVFIPQNNRSNGRVCQSVILNQNNIGNKNFDNKIVQQKGSLFPNSSGSSNISDLESTFSSDNNLSGWIDINSPMLSDPGSRPKKPQMFLNLRKNQQIWKSSAQLGQLKSSNYQSTAQLNLANTQFTSQPSLKPKQDNIAFQRRKLQPYKFEYKQKQKKPLPQLKKQQSEELIRPMEFKFRKKNNDGCTTNNIVDLKQFPNNFIPKQFTVVKQPPHHFTIDDFEIKEKLGRGTYGDVFLVRQKKTKFLCVLKCLSKKKIKEQNLQQLVFRQIKIQSYLVHKHITSLYGVFDDQNKIYLIMQCMPDGSMSSNGKKKISQNQTAHLLHQVLDGLQFMHRQDIIHRDIKPQNLLLNNTYLKIGDFGCAVFGNTLRRTIVGCYAYISPQQFSNNPYDQKIDSWSVGILAYELLTGRPPYQQKLRKIATQNQNKDKNQNSAESIPKIQFSELNFPKELIISTDAIDFIKRLLDPDPATRADVKEALKHKFLLKAREYEKYLQSKL